MAFITSLQMKSEKVKQVNAVHEWVMRSGQRGHLEKVLGNVRGEVGGMCFTFTLRILMRIIIVSERWESKPSRQVPSFQPLFPATESPAPDLITIKPTSITEN